MHKEHKEGPRPTGANQSRLSADTFMADTTGAVALNSTAIF